MSWFVPIPSSFPLAVMSFLLKPELCGNATFQIEEEHYPSKHLSKYVVEEVTD